MLARLTDLMLHNFTHAVMLLGVKADFLARSISHPNGHERELESIARLLYVSFGRSYVDTNVFELSYSPHEYQLLRVRTLYYERKG